ncbi:hypothetical protein SAMN05421640_1943 [Ekhidna lutea]|uniref:Uncharacterized protein n=1 Tax=Ekhidna lutea TaxID=447679 RepID=A0A239J1W0_EKHLU|nr:hypothetical protein [Ekhidna lutea]SNS99755.1 hypothetical protein SAMN05421640_1943 [Ekhidna lutea]
MKKSLIIIFSICLIVSVSAQTGAFKKILSEKNEVDRSVFYDQLIAFQKENTEFANVYFQLGKLELETFSTLDPIVDRVASRQRIYNTKTNFGLAKNYLDEKEVSRFPDWYDVPDLKDKDSVTSLGVNKVEKNYEDAISYSELYEELISNYDRAVYHYLKAREGFIEINTSADNLRQLFLKADDSLKIAVRAVGTSFDSSMYHIDIYRDIYQQLPHKKKRKVNINKRKIDHFRMNGITPANFLADNIDVWDYKQWSERFLKLLKEEVDGLQEEIKSAYRFFIATNERMISGDECIQAELDDMKFQRIINLITKYDNESVLIDVFQYLISKLEYGNKLTYERNCNELESPPTDDFLSRKARIYQNLYSSYEKADSLSDVIVSSGHSQESFQWFFDEMMPGDNGSQTFATDQTKENNQSFKEELSGLMQKIDMQQFNVDSLTECFESDSIFLIPGALPDENFCATKKLVLNDSLELLLGQKVDQNMLIGAAPLEEDYQKNWEIAPYKNSKVSYFKIVGDSTFMLSGVSGKAWVSQYSTNGKEYFTVTLRSADTVRNVMVNSLQGNATILQEGSAGFTLSRVNFSGKIESANTFTLPGSYIGMIRQEQSMWFFSHETTAEGSKITASILDASGQVSGEFVYQFESQLARPKIIKNDNEYLTLLSANAFAGDEIVYALMNYEGEIESETIF